MEEFLNQVITTLIDGGWLMGPLAVVALAAYGVAFSLILYFSRHSFYKMPKATLLNAVANPGKATGELKEIIDYALGDNQGPDDTRSRFREIKEVYLGRIDRDRIILFTLISIAPLMGLLGTVGGMLVTFRGLAVNSGGQTVDLIAGGISEALITTQAGLMIALPGYVFSWMVMRRRDALATCLSAIEVAILIHQRKGKSEEAA